MLLVIVDPSLAADGFRAPRRTLRSALASYPARWSTKTPSPMFKIHITVTKPKTGAIAASVRRLPHEVDCDRCGLHTWTTVGALGRHDAIICRGCHCTLLLDDGQGTARAAERKAERILDKAIDTILKPFR